VNKGTSKILVSVCIITYNHQEFIAQTIEGILSQQTEFDFEVIVSNDCSTDNTHRVVTDIIANHPKGALIKYYNQQKNLGIHSNAYFVINNSNGHYIAFCEGDDYWTDSTKLKKQINLFQTKPNLGLVHTDYNILNQSDLLLSEAVNKSKKIPSGRVYNELLQDNFIATLTVMVKRDVLLEAIEVLKEVAPRWGMLDYPWWLFISSELEVGYLSENTAIYRYLQSSASHSNSLSKNLSFLKCILLVRLHFNKYIKRVSYKELMQIKFKYYLESSLYIYRNLKTKNT
jgi:glycosyltransferase involved in cell wall biosynthesis